MEFNSGFKMLKKENKLKKENELKGACGGVVVKSEGSGIDPLSLGIFSGASDSSMCPGVDSAPKNEYQEVPGGKDGRCIRVTTLPPAECLEILEP
jgi:hypothetical protein